MMDHNKVVRLSLKYLNIAFGVLMIVVLSLSLESIQHSRRLTNVHEVVLLKNLRSSASASFDERAPPDRIKVLQCQSCNNDALGIITIFNACSAGLSTILAVFSFLLAFANRFYAKHKLIFSQGFIVTTIATVALFICSIIVKSPRSCDNELGKDCDSDFHYHFEYKIIPTSVMMLATIPQLLFKSIGILYMHFVKNEDGFCRNLWSFPYKAHRPSSADNYYEEYHSKRNSQAFEDMSFQKLNPNENIRRPHRPIETVAEKVSGKGLAPRAPATRVPGATENEYGFVTKIRAPKVEIEMDLMEASYREMPIDCPSLSASNSANTIDARDSIYESLPVPGYANPYLLGNEDFASRLLLSNGGQHVSIEKRRQSGMHEDESLEWQDVYSISQDNSTYDQFGKVYNVPLGRKFTRKSSLSTIAEERTMTTLNSGDQSAGSARLLNNTSSSLLERSKTSQQSQQSERVLLDNFLGELPDRSTFLNEVMHVFEPSSRDGTFNRNIPIRFSSPFKNKRPQQQPEGAAATSMSSCQSGRNLNFAMSTSIDLEDPSSSANNSWSSSNSRTSTPRSMHSRCSPASPSMNSSSKSAQGSPSPAVSALSLGCLQDRSAGSSGQQQQQQQQQQRVSSMTRLCLDSNNLLIFQANKKSPSDLNSLIVNALNAKKLRFVKRLKNRIETRRGRPLSQSLSAFSFTSGRSSRLNKSPSEPTREAMRDQEERPKRAKSSSNRRRLDFQTLHDDESYAAYEHEEANNNNNYILSTSTFLQKPATASATRVYENSDLMLNLNHTYESIGSRNQLISSSSSTIGANRSTSNMDARSKPNDLILVDKSVKPVYF